LWKIPRLDSSKTYTGEDLRHVLSGWLDQTPSTPNLWGAIINRALMDGSL